MMDNETLVESRRLVLGLSWMLFLAVLGLGRPQRVQLVGEGQIRRLRHDTFLIK